MREDNSAEIFLLTYRDLYTKKELIDKDYYLTKMKIDERCYSITQSKGPSYPSTFI